MNIQLLQMKLKNMLSKINWQLAFDGMMIAIIVYLLFFD